MSYSKSFYHGYGVQVELPEEWRKEHDESLEETLGFDTPVRAMAAGAYDADWHWLFIQDATPHGPEIEMGSYTKIDPYETHLDHYKQWDWWLVETAQEQGLKILEGPAWFFVPDCS